ncbi:putative MFS family arabinose efflux permease [Kribbella orskensis]|uniref:MFS family arabinose efflux permease n=1 Tax=Kribbella orskensis TaxID=2512216 RepID=A0ABY2BJA3_9ACTN|nr:MULTISPECIES: MFS transporter [Kribbella]TCN39359.1 putative MFS family arabinose efflux permease [Kribbella sp. VKM Ac-2500]TCO22006.1 putative MFS family arabinose efflux permease [Kribbella orskensis]
MPATTAQDRLTGRAWAVLFVLCGAIFLEGIDVSMMGVALPSIRAELGLSTSELQWIVSAYVLSYGGFVLLGGRAADLLGRRRMFIGWLVVFLAFSGLGGFASEGWVLIVARFVTGIAAAFMTPAGLSIITTTYPEGPHRNKALLVYAGTAAGGFSLGMVAGGLLTAIDWRWVFFAPVVLAAVILVAAIALIPREAEPLKTAGGFDLGGALTLTGSMLLLVSTVVRAPDVAAGQTAVTLMAGLVLLGLFVVIEQRVGSPLIRLGILRSGPLVRANLGAVLLVGSFVGFQFIAVLYLQELRNWSGLETGLALMVIGIDSVLAPTLTPWLVNRFGNGRVVFGGFTFAAAAYALFLPLGADWSYAAMLPTLILLGLAFALAYGPLTIAATDGVAEEEQGLASGVLTTSFQFGSALGLAVVAAVLAAADDLTVEGFRSALLVPLVAAALGLLAALPGLTRRPAPQPAA